MSRHATTIVNYRRSLAAFLMAALFHATFSPAVLIGQEDQSSTAEPAKPKVDEIGTVKVESEYGTARLPFYIQQGKTPEEKDAHVYYPPWVYVVTDKGNIRHHVEEDGEIVLFIRYAGDAKAIEEAVRKELVVMAKEENPDFKIERGTKPYRIDVLPIYEARLTVSDRRGFVSERIKGYGWEQGNVPVHFYLSSSDEAEGFVEDLQRGTVSLVYEYTFDGVSDETCTARLEASQIQDVDLFKRLTGEGGEGKVARHQVVDLADQIVSRWKSVSRCADYAVSSDLTESVLDALDGSDTLTVVDWDRLEKHIAIPPEDLKADVETGTKKLKKTVARDRLEDAWSSAYSEAESEATESGGAFGISAIFKKFPIKLGFGASGSKGKASSEAAALAMKHFQDILRKEGISTEWNGKRFIPKSVEVYSTSKLRSAWAKTFEKTITLTSGETARHEVILTKESWTEVIPLAKERQIDRLLEDMGIKMEGVLTRQRNQTNRLNAQVDQLKRRQRDHEDGVRNDLRNAISVQTCNYQFNVGGSGEGDHYHDLRRDDDVAIIAGINGCSDLDWATMNLSRMSSRDDDWALFVNGLRRPCKFWLSVVFLDGARVNRSRTYKTSRSGYGKINTTKKWCH